MAAVVKERMDVVLVVMWLGGISIGWIPNEKGRQNTQEEEYLSWESYDETPRAKFVKKTQIFIQVHVSNTLNYWLLYEIENDGPQWVCTWNLDCPECVSSCFQLRKRIVLKRREVPFHLFLFAFTVIKLDIILANLLASQFLGRQLPPDKIKVLPSSKSSTVMEALIHWSPFVSPSSWASGSSGSGQ